MPCHSGYEHIGPNEFALRDMERTRVLLVLLEVEQGIPVDPLLFMRYVPLHYATVEQRDQVSRLTRSLDEKYEAQIAAYRQLGAKDYDFRDDGYTAILCGLLREHPDTSSLSLCARLWWECHQILDAKRKERERKAREASEQREALRKSALGKLTSEELKSLRGVL